MAGEAENRLGILFVGALGSVATTTAAGVHAIARDLAPARGMLTEGPLAGSDLAPLRGLRFGGWDLAPGSPSEAARRAGVVPPGVLDEVAEDLDAMSVLPAPSAGVSPVVLRSAGAAGGAQTRREAAERLVRDVGVLKERLGVQRAVVVNVASTEPAPRGPHLPADPDAFEGSLDRDDERVTPAMLYAYAAIRTGCPFVNFTPSVAAEAPPLDALARERRVPYAGKDGKTGQTLYKGVLAAMFRLRDLRVTGWYSANVLGNRDGEVLEDPEHGRPKLDSKAAALSQILGYGEFPHRVRIDYYPPRGDNKEAWDVVDFEGWLGARMSVRVNWQGADSPLAAPLVVDLARLADRGHRAGAAGPLPELGLYFKSPHACDEHHPFRQLDRLVAWRERLRARPVPVEEAGAETLTH